MEQGLIAGLPVMFQHTCFSDTTEVLEPMYQVKLQLPIANIICQFCQFPGACIRTAANIVGQTVVKRNLSAISVKTVHFTAIADITFRKWNSGLIHWNLWDLVFLVLFYQHLQGSWKDYADC